MTPQGPRWLLARLTFMSSVRVGLRLIPVCWSVLTQQVSLLLVPFLVLAAGALAVTGYTEAFGGYAALTSGTKYVVAFRLFPILAFVGAIGSIGQAVVVAASTDILQGSRTSLGKAWLTTANQLPRLLVFGVVLAGERTLTSLLRGRKGWSPGDLVADVIDRAWDFATFLAVPVILYENLPVFESVRRSGKLVRQRFGSELTARWVLGLALFVFSLPLVLLALVVMYKVSISLGMLMIAVIALAVTIFGSALTGVLSAALYRYAITGLVAPSFTEADMWAAFSRR
jgi:hypothetical protein